MKNSPGGRAIGKDLPWAIDDALSFVLQDAH